MIAAYRFDSPDKIIRGRIGGRQVFSKRFREELVELYGARDAITGERYAARYLQIDHRVPYEIAGDPHPETPQPAEYMLLTASSQRAKSWSCEHCPNWQEDRSEDMCRSCFWAFPDNYSHVAGEEIRRVDIEWRGTEVRVFDKIRKRALVDDMTVAAVIKRLLERLLQ